jgi:hypothetical protein
MTPWAAASNPGYERRDARVGWVVAGASIVVLGIASCFAVATWLDRPANRAARPSGPELSFRHGVVDESGIDRDWRAQDAEVRRHLETYAWVQRDSGLVQIPIARAMDLLVEESADRAKANP